MNMVWHSFSTLFMPSNTGVGEQFDFGADPFGIVVAVDVGSA